jgi:hypothetical protein
LETGDEILDSAAYPDQLLLVLSLIFIIGTELCITGIELSAKVWSMGVDPNNNATNIAGIARAGMFDLIFKKDKLLLKNLMLDSYMHFHLLFLFYDF